MDLVTNILKIFGIVFLRYRPLARIWNVWLVGVNLMCLCFLGHVEAQVVLGTTLVAVVLQGIIYGRIGFTRVLGVGHLLWIPMFAWMATRTDEIAAHSDLQIWIMVLAITNMVSFAIDLIDVTRFARGERAPHYRWN